MRRTPPALDVLRHALATKRARRWAVFSVLAYLVIYLFAIQNLIVSFATDFSRFADVPSVQVVEDWMSRAFKQQAAFYYESVAVVYVTDHVKVMVSPVNIAMGSAIAALVGVNVAVAIHLLTTARTCRRSAFSGLLGALPAFLGGFACCVPTVALVLGAQFTVALIALRSYFFPFALAALLLSLVWNLRRARDLQVASPSSATARQVPVG